MALPAARFRKWLSLMDRSLAKHFGDDENEERSTQTASQQKIDKRISDGGKQRGDDQGCHKFDKLKV